jgi:hypothetical protein
MSPRDPRIDEQKELFNTAVSPRGTILVTDHGKGNYVLDSSGNQDPISTAQMLTSFGGSPRIAATTAELEVESLSTALFSKVSIFLTCMPSYMNVLTKMLSSTQCPNTNAVFGLPKLPIENGGCGGVGLSEEDATYVPAPGTPRAVILFHTNPGLVKDIFHSLDRSDFIVYVCLFVVCRFAFSLHCIISLLVLPFIILPPVLPICSSL